MRPLIISKLKSFASLEITGRRAVDGARYHFAFPLFRKFTTYYYTFSYRLDPVLRRYIGISSVYRR